MAAAIKKLDTDDAAYLIADLDRQQRSEILAKIPKEERLALNRALDIRRTRQAVLMQMETLLRHIDLTKLSGNPRVGPR